MLDRKLRTILVAWLGVFALLAVADNLVNLEQAHGAVAYVVGHADHTIYPNGVLPKLGASAAWIVLAVICACEILVGIFCLLAATRMWRARANEAQFLASLQHGKLAAAGVALLWFVFFWVFGVAGYVMWQTAVGQESASSAFRISAFGFFTLIYLGQYRTPQELDA